MTITINALHYNTMNAECIEALVPFRSVPFRTPLTPAEEHPFYRCVDYATVSLVSTNEDYFSVLLDVTITEVNSFRIDDDCFEIEFFGGDIATFEIIPDDFSRITII